MFTTSLAFVIFVWSEFALHSKQIVDQVRVGVGSDLVFIAPSITQSERKDDMITDFESLKATFSEISGKTFDHIVVLVTSALQRQPWVT